jgi:hypothetical protein
MMTVLVEKEEQVSLETGMPTIAEPKNLPNAPSRYSYARSVCAKAEASFQRSDQESIVGCYFWETVKLAPALDEPEF